METSPYSPGDFVRWVDQLSNLYVYGQLRYSYDTHLGRHWSIRKHKLGTTTYRNVTRSEKQLTRVEESEMPI